MEPLASVNPIKERNLGKGKPSGGAQYKNYLIISVAMSTSGEKKARKLLSHRTALGFTLLPSNGRFSVMHMHTLRVNCVPTFNEYTI